MDWSEAVRKAAILAEEQGHITFDQLNGLLLSTVEPEDITSLMAPRAFRSWRTLTRLIRNRLVPFAGKFNPKCFN
jgi:hypothetical protein